MTTGTVSLVSTLLNDLTVSLSSSDTTEATSLKPTKTIPAGQFLATFHRDSG